MNDSIALLDAVETLSNIAESGVEIGMMEEHSVLLHGKPVQYRTVHWITQKGGEDSILRIRRVFKTIYDYIQDKSSDVDGVRALMVLVNQAARKLDLSGLVKSKELSEYQDLDKFYQKQIVPQVDQGKLGQWMLALTKEAIRAKRSLKIKGVERKPLLIDLEAVKSDQEYELFFLKKEDGTHFYNPRLLRSIQLVCHFGERFYDKRDEEDPFAEIGNWLHLRQQAVAKAILNSIHNRLNRFYRLSQKKQDDELIANLKKCIMALMLASQPRNKGKGSENYFADFQKYFREILYSPDYHRLISYPIKTKDFVSHCVVDLIQRIAHAIHREASLFNHLFPHIGQMIEGALNRYGNGKEQKTFWGKLARDYGALAKFAKGHVTGSLERLLSDLHTGGTKAYDPWMMHNTPSHLYKIQIDEKSLDCLHMPCPVVQEFIHKAVINEEFKNFLRGNDQDDSHLIFNMQDRTSWKEHARCHALEELQHAKPFEERVHVVTFAKTTDFYNQTDTYAKEQNAELFKYNLKEHLSDANTGFYFPEKLSVLVWEDLDPLIEEIHQTYFSGKNVLTRDQRLDFIEITYLCLQMHLLAMIKPSSFSFICKDGVDNGAVGAALFWAGAKLLAGEQLSEKDRDMINYVLHTPALMNRERVIHQKTFQRFINALRTLEGVQEQEGKQASLRLSKFINLPVFLA